MIHESVAKAWHAFSEPLEGRVHSMYLDVKGLVTVGVGNLIDTPAQASALPFVHTSTGARATPGEIAAAWFALKARQDLPKLHWKYAARLNDLRLSDAAIDALVQSKLTEFAAHMQRHHFPEFPHWPADAQLATLSMAWACGPGFPATFKNFREQARKRDWLAAKACCKIRERGNPGVVPRNRANEKCFDNAHTVETSGGLLDPAELHWPALVLEPIEITP